MVDLGRQYLNHKNEIDNVIQSVLDSGHFIGGDEVQEFAENFAAFNNVKNVITCGSGTDALQIALMALDLKPGSEIILPSFTFVATAETVALLGFKPVFVDVDLISFTIDVSKIEENININTAAIIPVHLYGQNANLEKLMQIALEHGLKVIEDAAQSVGSEYIYTSGLRMKSGTIGHIGITSFFPSKNLGAYGDGGAILTNDRELADTCKQIANHGQSKKYFSDRIGVNSRLDSIQAAILNVKLKYLDEFTLKRQKNSTNYDNLLSDIATLTIPERVNYSSHVFHQYTIKVSDKFRDDLRNHLLMHNVPTMVYYPVPIHKQNAYLEFNHGHLENTELLSKTVISLPMHPDLKLEEQVYIAELIIDFFKRTKLK